MGFELLGELRIEIKHMGDFSKYFGECKAGETNQVIVSDKNDYLEALKNLGLFKEECSFGVSSVHGFNRGGIIFIPDAKLVYGKQEEL